MKKIRQPKPSSVKLNFIMNAVLKMSAFVFPLITFPYVSRILGAIGNGKITFAASVISYFSMFAQLGIPTYGIKICASCRDDEKKLNKTVQELLIINLSTVLISYAAFFVCIQTIPRLQNDKTLMIISSATIFLNAVGMDWLFQALEQYSYITIRSIAFKLLSIILMFAFVHKPEDYVAYGAISVIGSCGSSILNFFYANRFLEHKRFERYDFKRHVKPILSFFMLSVSVSVYTQMDSVMLGFMSSDAEVGYYAAATKMKAILVSAVTALGGVMLPRVSNYIAHGKIESFYMMIKKSLNFVLVVASAVTIYFLVMSGTTIQFLAGEGYEPAVMPMQIIAVTVILIGLSNITGMQVLVPTNREKITTASTVIGASVNLFLNALTIPHFGAIGAALGTVFAEAAVLLTQLFNLRRELPEICAGIPIRKILIANVIATFILVELNSYLELNNCFITLCVTACVFFGIYGATLAVVKEPLISEYLNVFKKKLGILLKRKNER